jgi:hypothetical protein
MDHRSLQQLALSDSVLFLLLKIVVPSYTLTVETSSEVYWYICCRLSSDSLKMADTLNITNMTIQTGFYLY